MRWAKAETKPFLRTFSVRMLFLATSYLSFPFVILTNIHLPPNRFCWLSSPTSHRGFYTTVSFHHQWRVFATDKILEKRTILWILGDKRPVEPTQSRKGAETQRFRLVSTITRRVNHLNLSFPWYLPVLCVFASWRLCVNCRSWAYCPARQVSGERPSWALKA